MLKRIIYSVLPINAIDYLIKSMKMSKNISNVIKYLLILISPILFVYGIVYVGMFLYGFLIWEFPKTIPFPITKPLVNIIVDRLLIIIGIIFLVVSLFDDNNKRL